MPEDSFPVYICLDIHFETDAQLSSFYPDFNHIVVHSIFLLFPGKAARHISFGGR
jgi:hypothetical protein